MKNLGKIALLISLGLTALNAQSLNSGQKDAVQKLVQLYGYKCDSVSYASRSSWDGSVRFVCNNNQYVYEVKDVGGTWKVKVK